MTLGTLYRQLKTKLKSAGIETPELEAKLLLSYAYGCAPDDVLLKPDTHVTASKTLDETVARRMAGEPVSKIVGTRGFYGLDFEVTHDVLDPRADTETLVDAARKGMVPNAHILDICTGSGCIPLTLLSLFPNAVATATDISIKALEVAARNAQKLGYAGRITFIQTNWLEGVEGVFDVITCNPPYIPSADIAALDAGVRLYDPLLALDGGTDGLEPYRIVFPQIRKFLKTGGAAFFECGIGQADDVSKLAKDCGLHVNGIVPDLAGIPRVVCLK